MPRPLQRATLENGIKLDLNRLARRGFIDPGGYKGSGISWKSNYTGEVIASGLITADMSGTDEGWFRIQIGQLDQQINLAAYHRHFGGKQWYFICSYTNRRVSVLWMPPGARYFACRQAWVRQVAYASQFRDLISRAHAGKAKINARLCSIGGFDPDEWDLPPKPKWMRWNTYNRAVEKFDRYEEMLDTALFWHVAKLVGC
jgi:subtilisin family serine protease